MKTVDALGIRLQHRFGIRRKLLQLLLSRANNAQAAQELIGFQRGRAKYFAQQAVHHAPIGL